METVRVTIMPFKFFRVIERETKRNGQKSHINKI